MFRFPTGEHNLDVRYRSLPLLAEMADGFGAPRYGLASYCGPSPFSRYIARAHIRALLACALQEHKAASLCPLGLFVPSYSPPLLGTMVSSVFHFCLCDSYLLGW